MIHLVAVTIHLVSLRAVSVKYQNLYGFIIKLTMKSSYIKLFSLFFDWVKERIVLVTPHL